MPGLLAACTAAEQAPGPSPSSVPRAEGSLERRASGAAALAVTGSRTVTPSALLCALPDAVPTPRC